jgi:hypothetical protein
MIFVVNSFKKFIILLKKGIQIKNIINMDQVPRYFETEPKSTMTIKGSCEVLLRKGGGEHLTRLLRSHSLLLLMVLCYVHIFFSVG